MWKWQKIFCLVAIQIENNKMFEWLVGSTFTSSQSPIYFTQPRLIVEAIPSVSDCKAAISVSISGCNAISPLLVDDDDCNSVQCLLSASASFFNDITNALIFRFSSSGQLSSSTMSLADSGRLRKTSFTIAKCVVGRILILSASYLIKRLILRHEV